MSDTNSTELSKEHKAVNEAEDRRTEAWRAYDKVRNSYTITEDGTRVPGDRKEHDAYQGAREDYIFVWNAYLKASAKMEAPVEATAPSRGQGEANKADDRRSGAVPCIGPGLLDGLNESIKRIEKVEESMRKSIEKINQLEKDLNK